MNPRSTAILLVVAAALGAFVWFYEIEGEAGREEAAEAEKRLFAGLEADAVAWVELEASGGERVRAERSDGVWSLVEPLGFPGDAGAWDGIASTLVSLTGEASFDSPQADEVYGLGEGAGRVRFGAGDAAHALELGDEAPLGGNRYARVAGETAVHTVTTWRINGLTKDLDELRDKSLLDFVVGDVVAFEAEWPGSRVSLQRDGDAWRVTSPVDGPADDAVVSRLLSDLAFLRADGFQDEPLSDADAGLDPPAYRAAVSLGGDAESDAPPRVIELAVGSVEVDGSRYARAGQSSLYRIAAARLDDLPRDAAAYRYKQLAEFSEGEVASVELVFRDGDAEPVRITATRGDAGWSSEPEAVDPTRLAALVRVLSALTAETILAERVGPDELAGLGLDPPNAAFHVRDAAGEALAEVRLGALQGDAGIVAQSGENPQVFRLALARSEQLPVSLDAVRNRFLAPDVEPGEAPSGVDLELLREMIDAEEAAGETAP